MRRVEASSDYFTHKIAEGTSLQEIELTVNAKYCKALARSDELTLDHHFSFLKDYLENNISTPNKKYLVSKSNQEEY